jgi:hypothetical protein
VVGASGRQATPAHVSWRPPPPPPNFPRRVRLAARCLRPGEGGGAVRPTRLHRRGRGACREGRIDGQTEGQMDGWPLALCPTARAVLSFPGSHADRAGNGFAEPEG